MNQSFSIDYFLCLFVRLFAIMSFTILFYTYGIILVDSIALLGGLKLERPANAVFLKDVTDRG